MDVEAAGPIAATIAGDGLYLRRAQALLAARAELFQTYAQACPPRPVRRAAVAGPPSGRGGVAVRATGRQLVLPLPRERTRRRPRMVR